MGEFTKAAKSAAGAVADPRVFQILFLGILLAAGACFRDFALRPGQIVLTFAAALATQALCSRLAGKPISYRSAVITSLGLTLLLRANSMWVHPAAASAAIASKFVVRIRGKHLFNPANLGVTLALLLAPGTWVSPGQWGQDVAFAGWLIVLGALVVRRAHRGDISWAFVLFYVGALAARALWLGQSGHALMHQLANGALLLFAFFMISDPMTIPNHARGRIAHAALVGAIGFVWQFWFYANNGLLWALLIAAPAVPLWDALWTAPKFEWNGGSHEQPINEALAGAPRAAAARLAGGGLDATRHAA